LNHQALHSYTQALLFAEEGSEAMALAYANRYNNNNKNYKQQQKHPKQRR
jgi:hypothetical protein